MAVHEHFEDAIIRSILGETTEGEYAALKAHLMDCSACCLLAAQYGDLIRRDLPLVHHQHARKGLSKHAQKGTAPRVRFLRVAEQKGFHFSPAMEHRSSGTRWSIFGLSSSETVATAVVLLVLGAGCAVYFASSNSRSVSTQIASLQRQLDEARQEQARSVQTAERSSASEQVSLTEASGLRDRVALLQKQLDAAEFDLHRQVQDGTALREASQEKDSALRVADQKLLVLQSGFVQAKSENQSLEERHRSDEVVATIQQKRLDELTGDLKAKDAVVDRTKQLMSADRDIRDLMGARQLHIVDVFDADSNGKRQRRFGRVFYTEGKSLVFYAFDLTKPGVVEAKESFQAWGAKYGESTEAVSLGMFYLDDKLQRRWTVKVDDPALLSEIDSVFVTAEPSKDGKKPTGRRFLFAFLKNPANHP